MSNQVTNKIERAPYFVAAKNEFEAMSLARAKFARDGADYFRSSLNHHTTGKPVYKCVMLANGEILVGVHQ